MALNGTIVHLSPTKLLEKPSPFRGWFDLWASKCGIPWDNVGVQSPFAFIDAALLPSKSLTEITVPGDCPLSKAYIRSQPSFRSLQHSQSISNENNRVIHLFFKQNGKRYYPFER